jgi:hypothetical protein
VKEAGHAVFSWGLAKAWSSIKKEGKMEIRRPLREASGSISLSLI